MVSVDTPEDGTLPCVRDISPLLLSAPALAGFGRELPSSVFELAGDQRDTLAVTSSAEADTLERSSFNNPDDLRPNR